MNVNYNGYGENIATFIAESSLKSAGLPVKISANGTVAACSSGDNFCGICVAVRDGYAAVQLSGYVQVKTSAKLALGFTKLATGSNGAVASNTNGREHLVIDSTTTSAGILL